MSANEIFKNSRYNSKKLLAYGFKETADRFVFEREILDGQFNFSVSVLKSGGVESTVTDLSTDEEYILYRITGATGAFVGAVKDATDDILNDIKESCFDEYVFKSSQAREVIDFVENTFSCRLEFLWEKLPDCAIWRRDDNKKWFGIIITVDGSKVNREGVGKIEVLDFRAPTDFIERIVDNELYFPGYHMNKKHWLTVCLDNSLSTEKIKELLSVSFDIAKKK